MHIANQLLFKALIVLGKKLFPNLSVLHFKRVNWLKFLKLYTCSFSLLMQFFSLFSHRVHFDVCPTYGILVFLAHHNKIDLAI